MNTKHYCNPLICAPVLDYTIALNSSDVTGYTVPKSNHEGKSALKRWQQHLHNTRLARQRH